MFTFTFWTVSVSFSYERPVKFMRVMEMRTLFNKEACTYFQQSYEDKQYSDLSLEDGKKDRENGRGYRLRNNGVETCTSSACVHSSKRNVTR
jgi:hypothetical protein